MPAHPPYDAERPLRARLRTDGDQRTDRQIARGLHRRHQSESGQRNVLDFPLAAGGGVLREPMTRKLSAAVAVVADAAEHRKLQRAAKTLSRVELVRWVAVFFTQVTGDLA